MRELPARRGQTFVCLSGEGHIMSYLSVPFLQGYSTIQYVLFARACEGEILTWMDYGLLATSRSVFCCLRECSKDGSKSYRASNVCKFMKYQHLGEFCALCLDYYNIMQRLLSH